MAKEKSQRRYYKRYTVYGGTQPFTVAASSSGTDSFNISKFASFYPVYLTYKATSAEMLIQIRMANYNMFQIPVHLKLVSGAFDAIFPLPKDIIFEMPASQAVMIDYQDKSGSTNYIYLGLVGYEKIYY